MITLSLPCVCPEPDCASVLQRALKPDLGVKPHYDVIHPGRPVPEVQASSKKHVCEYVWLENHSRHVCPQCEQGKP